MRNIILLCLLVAVPFIVFADDNLAKDRAVNQELERIIMLKRVSCNVCEESDSSPASVPALSPTPPVVSSTTSSSANKERTDVKLPAPVQAWDDWINKHMW